MGNFNDFEGTIHTKQDKRIKKRETQNKKWVKHGYGNAWSPKFLDKPTKLDKKRIKEKLKKIKS